MGQRRAAGGGAYKQAAGAHAFSDDGIAWTFSKNDKYEEIATKIEAITGQSSDVTTFDIGYKVLSTEVVPFV